jgi:hypothetical protein
LDIQGQLGRKIISSTLEDGTGQKGFNLIHSQYVHGIARCRKEEMVTSVFRMAIEIMFHLIQRGGITLIRISKVGETNEQFRHNHSASPVINEVDGGTDVMENLAEVDGNGINCQVAMETSGRETKKEAHVWQRRKTKIGSEITCCYIFLLGTV